MTLVEVLKDTLKLNELMERLTIELAAELDEINSTHYIVAECEYDPETIEAYKYLGYNMKTYKVQFNSFVEALKFKNMESAFDWIDDVYRLRTDKLIQFSSWRV